MREVDTAFPFDGKFSLYASLSVVGDEYQAFRHTDSTDNHFSGAASADMVNRSPVGSLVEQGELTGIQVEFIYFTLARPAQDAVTVQIDSLEDIFHRQPCEVGYIAGRIVEQGRRQSVRRLPN